MDHHIPAARELRTSTPQPPWPPNLSSTGDDAAPACRIVEATVAIAFGLALPHGQATKHKSGRVAMAHHVAMYLAHVALGIPMARIAQVFGRHRTTVTHACHGIEDRRDDPQFDRLLDCLEEAVAALRQAYDIHQQR